jgi:hypothetical protein
MRVPARASSSARARFAGEICAYSHFVMDDLCKRLPSQTSLVSKNPADSAVALTEVQDAISRIDSSYSRSKFAAGLCGGSPMSLSGIVFADLKVTHRAD